MSIKLFINRQFLARINYFLFMNTPGGVGKYNCFKSTCLINLRNHCLVVRVVEWRAISQLFLNVFSQLGYK